ncbi:HPt (histidine-containing phosphotransfer) domain-containing protein [Sporosarcina luteola]|nr:HPt (histidine-containing phosphotransfer) domain-containing protein [Sporosarcina luteola]
MVIRKPILILLLAVLLAGCSRDDFRFQNDSDEAAAQTESIIRKDKRIKSAAVVLYEEKLLAGIRVETFSRYKKKKIASELKKKLEEQYPDMEVTVSADSKILYETNKLIDEGNKDKLGKEIDRLTSLLKEET